MVRFKTSELFEVSKKFVAVAPKVAGADECPHASGREVRAPNRQHLSLRIFPMLRHPKLVLVCVCVKTFSYNTFLNGQRSNYKARARVSTLVKQYNPAIETVDFIDTGGHNSKWDR